MRFAIIGRADHSIVAVGIDLLVIGSGTRRFMLCFEWRFSVTKFPCQPFFMLLL